jgi:Spy/CpxP family protein refolding chaperone
MVHAINGAKTMNATTSSSRLRLTAVMAIVLTLFAFELQSEAMQRGSPGRKLTPPTGRREDPPRPSDSQRNPRRPDFTEEDRRDMRLVPQGVAYPRALIRVFRELKLNEDQLERLTQLSRRSGNQIPMLNRLRKAQSDLLDEALYGENFDPKLVEKRAADLSSTQSEIIKQQARIMSEIRQILTPGQSAQFRDLLTREREELIREQLENRSAPPPSIP